MDGRHGGHHLHGEPLNHRRCHGGSARRRRGRRWPGGVPRARPRRRSGPSSTRAAPGGTGGYRCAGSRQGQKVQRPPVPRPGSASGETERAQRGGARVGQAHDQVEDPVQHHTATGERGGHAVVGPWHPTRSEPGHRPRRFAACEATASARRTGLRAAATRRGGPRPRPRRRAVPRVRHPTGRRSRPCARAGGTARGRDGTGRSRRRGARPRLARCAPPATQQLARPEEQARGVFAPGGDRLVGGVLEPGPQPAGQAGIEERARRGVAAQHREDVPASATIGRRQQDR